MRGSAVGISRLGRCGDLIVSYYTASRMTRAKVRSSYISSPVLAYATKGSYGSIAAVMKGTVRSLILQTTSEFVREDEA